MKRPLRAAVLVLVACVISTFTVTLTQSPAYAAITQLQFNASSAVNTNTAFHVTATSDQSHVQAATVVNLVGPNGVNGQPQTITGSGVTVTGSDVAATFNLDAGGVPANPGSWILQICDVSCAADALSLENSSPFSIQGTSAVITGFQPGQRASNSGDVTFTVTGKGFAYGTRVSTTPSNGNVTFSNYTTQSATQISGTLSVGAVSAGTSFGITVLNTNGSSSTLANGLTITSPPSITQTQPTTINLGQGAVGYPVTFTGTNLAPSGPSLSVRMTDGTTADNNVTVNVSNASATGFVATFSVASADVTGARKLYITNPDGGFVVRNMTITPAPTIIGTYARGQGAAASNMTVTGSNFVPGVVVVFNGGGLTNAGTTRVSSSQLTVNNLAVSGSATTGARVMSVINGDGGRIGCTCFTVDPGPTITSLSPPAAGKTGTTGITVSGQNFHIGGNLSFSVPHYTVSTPTNVTATSADITLTAHTASDAPTTGFTTITVLNTDDKGASTRDDLLSVDKFSVTSTSPTGGVNDDPSVAIDITGANFGNDNDQLTLVLHATNVPDQPDVSANGVVSSGGTHWAGTVSLLNVAPGTYTVRLVDANHDTGTCTCAFTVGASGPPTVTSIDPTGVAQGRTMPATITGTGFTPGTTIAFTQAGYTASNVAYVDSTTLTADVSVGASTTGSSTFKASLPNGGGTSGNCACSVTADANPSVTNVSPGTAGDGAVDRQITVTGTSLPLTKASYDFTGDNEGVTIASVSGASSTSIVLHVNVSSDATGTRDLVVTNAADGGTTTNTAALTVNPAPAPTALSPTYMARGGTATITIDGTGFDSGATPTFPHIAVTGVTVNNGQITGQATADDSGSVARGPQSLTVTNGDGGVGTCTCTVVLADPPGAPTPGTVLAASGTLSVSFTAPSDDGGASPLSYAATATPHGGGTPVNGQISGTTASFSGLTNGTLYDIAITASNAVGTGQPGTTSGTPQSTPGAPALTGKAGNRSILAAWKAPASTGGATIDSFKLTAQPGSISFTVSCPCPVAMAHTIAGLTNDQPETIQVVAHNVNGNGTPAAIIRVPRVPVNDYNGDSRSDVAVWRPSNGTWYVKGGASTAWGRSGDVPVAGDYNGDGRTDLAVWRPSNGTWYVKGGANTAWGRSGDVPVAGDYNGDGRTDLAVWRPSNGTWYVKGMPSASWGRNGDTPVVDDVNRDGKADLLVWRPSNGTWYLKGGASTPWGRTGDRPVAGDFNGDGRSDLAVWRASNGIWYVKGVASTAWGRNGDVPVAGDYNGDGRTDLVVWRSSNATWYVKGQPASAWGSASDIPV